MSTVLAGDIDYGGLDEDSISPKPAAQHARNDDGDQDRKQWHDHADCE